MAVMVAYFIKRMITHNDEQHKTFEEKIASIEDGIDEKMGRVNTSIRQQFSEVSSELKDQRKQIISVKEEVSSINAKQERLDIFSMKIDSIQKVVSDHAGQEFGLKEDIKEVVGAVEKIKNTVDEYSNKVISIENRLNKPIEHPGIDHILESPYIGDARKQMIKNHYEDMKADPTQHYKISGFIKYIEREIEQIKITTLNNGVRISQGIVDDIEQSRERMKKVK